MVWRAILGLALAAGAAASAGTAGPAPRKPNIVFIVADDLGYGDIGVQGNPDVPTPHIDSLAREGVRFTQGYVTGPVCSPTRAGLLTGRYQQRFGNDGNPPRPGEGKPEAGMALSETLFPDRLRSAGYRTGLVGKWHLGYGKPYHPMSRGFDEFFGFLSGSHGYQPDGQDARNPIMRGTQPVSEREYLTDAFGREAVAFVERHRARPFFLMLSFNAVHTPMHAGPAAARFAHIADRKRRTYAAMLGGMDDAIGRLMETLRRERLEQDTLVVFLSDNGGPTKANTSRNDPLRGYKGSVWEGGVRVPFLARWKGRLPAGRIHQAPVSSLDLAPTALAVAGVPVAPEWKLDGVDLTPFLTGRADGPTHPRYYWRFHEQWAIREGDWKLLREGGKTRLFNLVDDVGEARDLARQEPQRAAALRAAWEAWNRELPRR